MSRRKRMIEELDQDIRDHIAIETQDNIERGMTPEKARHAALRKFGNIAKVKDETHEVWSMTWLERLLQDVRFGERARRPRGALTPLRGSRATRRRSPAVTSGGSATAART